MRKRGNYDYTISIFSWKKTKAGSERNRETCFNISLRAKIWKVLHDFQNSVREVPPYSFPKHQVLETGYSKKKKKRAVAKFTTELHERVRRKKMGKMPQNTKTRKETYLVRWLMEGLTWDFKLMIDQGCLMKRGQLCDANEYIIDVYNVVSGHQMEKLTFWGISQKLFSSSTVTFCTSKILELIQFKSDWIYSAPACEMRNLRNVATRSI